MTFDAIFKIGDSFFDMFSTHVGERVFMAAVAGVIGIGALVAGDAVDVVFASVIDGEGVHHQLRGCPRACGVAALAIDPELADVDFWFGVTINAIAG